MMKKAAILFLWAALPFLAARSGPVEENGDVLQADRDSAAGYETESVTGEGDPRPGVSPAEPSPVEADTLETRERTAEIKAHRRSNLSEIDQMREEVRGLRHESERLGRMAERLDEEADDLESNIDDLIEKADFLEQKVEALTDLSDSAGSGEIDSTDFKAVDRFIDQQRELIVRLRANANELAIKAKQIAMKVRTMEEMADEREEAADVLEERADQLEEDLDTLPLQIRFPFQVGLEHRFSAVPPYDDHDPHLLMTGGFGVTYYWTHYLCAGINNITLYFNETMVGTRVAAAFAPTASVSIFPLRRIQLGGGIGGLFEIQAGAGKQTDVAVVPYLTLFNQNWVSRRVSIGPVLTVNYAARGICYTRSIPSGSTDILPEKAWWMEGGIALYLHF